MDFPILITAQCVLQAVTVNYDVCLSMKIVFILANSADPDEIQHYAAFHLDLHCLPKYMYSFRDFQYTKG